MCCTSRPRASCFQKWDSKWFRHGVIINPTILPVLISLVWQESTPMTNNRRCAMAGISRWISIPRSGLHSNFTNNCRLILPHNKLSLFDALSGATGIATMPRLRHYAITHRVARESLCRVTKMSAVCGSLSFRCFSISSFDTLFLVLFVVLFVVIIGAVRAWLLINFTAYVSSLTQVT